MVAESANPFIFLFVDKLFQASENAVKEKPFTRQL